MRKPINLVLVSFLVFFAPAMAKAANPARDLIDQAIRAHGGPDRLARAKYSIREAKGVLFYLGKETKFTTRLTVALPDRLRDQIQIQEGVKPEIVRVLSGNQGWRAATGSVQPMQREEIQELRDEEYVIWLTTLVPLQDPSFNLTLLPETKLDNRPVEGVKVAHQGYPDANLYFDARSHLLVKIERRAREAGITGTKEYLFSNPREFNGITVAGQEVDLFDGRKITELTITSYEFPSTIEERAFAKP